MVAKVQTSTQPQSFADKCLDLASRQCEAHGGLAWQTVALTFSADGQRIEFAEYRVESLSAADGWHTALYDATRDVATCDCTAASFHRACCHAGVAFHYGRDVAQAWVHQSDDERADEAARDWAHEDNARCLGYTS